MSDILCGIMKFRHSNYEVTNTDWSYRENCLLDYLSHLNLVKRQYDVSGYAGIWDYYLRDVYGTVYKDHDELYDKDPWGRRFPKFIHETTHANDLYTYRGYYSAMWPNKLLENNVYVIVTTVDGEKVYCVDIIRDR